MGNTIKIIVWVYVKRMLHSHILRPKTSVHEHDYKIIVKEVIWAYVNDLMF